MDFSPKVKKVFHAVCAVLVTLATLNFAVFLLIVVMLRSIWPDMNEFLTRVIGSYADWVGIILAITVLLFLWFGWRAYRYWSAWFRERTLRILSIDKILLIPLVVIWNYMLLLIFDQAGVELMVFEWQLVYALPYVCAIFGAVSGGVLTWVSVKGGCSSRFAMALVILMLVAISLPVIVRPANVIEGALPEKPQVIAHRCAAVLAPENTLNSVRRASRTGVSGVEFDVIVSADGVPFLMHDTTLTRTTDVAKVFPARKNMPATAFTMDELKRLNAGEWFIQRDPFGTIANNTVTPQELAVYRNAKIPSLHDIAAFFKSANNLFLDVDIKPPDPKLEAKLDFKKNQRIIAGVLAASGLGKRVFFYDLYLDVPEFAGTFTLVRQILDPRTDTTKWGPVKSPSIVINTHHGSDAYLRMLKKAGYRVMAWTVDSPARFSQLWCMGIDYVKTNDATTMVEMKSPAWYLSFPAYLAAWLGIFACAATLGAGCGYLLLRRKG